MKEDEPAATPKLHSSLPNALPKTHFGYELNSIRTIPHYRNNTEASFTHATRYVNIIIETENSSHVSQNKSFSENSLVDHIYIYVSVLE